MELDIEIDENEPELTYPYKEMDTLIPLPAASESEPKNAIEVENPIEQEDETVPASVHEVGTLNLFLVGWLLFQDKCVVVRWRMHRSRRKENQRMSFMLVEKLGNAEGKVKCKKLKKELEEARIMPPKSAPMTQAAIRQMIKENVDGATAAKRARHGKLEMMLGDLDQLEVRMPYLLLRFNELALMCLRMAKLERVKVDAYIRGLTDNIKGEVTSFKLMVKDTNKSTKSKPKQIKPSTEWKSVKK
nr:hypothetical protein [Tanacetum cinerariifolium]